MLWGLIKFIGWTFICITAMLCSLVYVPWFIKYATLADKKGGSVDPLDQDAKFGIWCIGFIALLVYGATAYFVSYYTI